MGPVNLGGVSFEKDMGNNNEVNEGNSRSIDVGFLSCDWMDYFSEEEFIRQVLSNPKHGRIITRGHDVVPVWDLIKDQYPSGIYESERNESKDQYPVQTGPKLLGINKNSF